MADTGNEIWDESWKIDMVMGGGGAVRPAGGSAHPQPLAAQIRHDYRQQHPNPDPGTGLTKREKKEKCYS